MSEFRDKHNRSPNVSELDAYAATWTAAMIAGKQTEADQVLATFGRQLIEEERPNILEEALRGQTGKTIGLNIVSAFLYTCMLIALVVVLKRAGVDLLSIAASK